MLHQSLSLCFRHPLHCQVLVKLQPAENVTFSQDLMANEQKYLAYKPQQRRLGSQVCGKCGVFTDPVLIKYVFVLNLWAVDFSYDLYISGHAGSLNIKQEPLTACRTFNLNLLCKECAAGWKEGRKKRGR